MRERTVYSRDTLVLQSVLLLMHGVRFYVGVVLMSNNATAIWQADAGG